jgi:hypothetical protein
MVSDVGCEAGAVQSSPICGIVRRESLKDSVIGGSPTGVYAELQRPRKLKLR